MVVLIFLVLGAWWHLSCLFRRPGAGLGVRDDLLELAGLRQPEPLRVDERQAQKPPRLVSVTAASALQQADREVRPTDEQLAHVAEPLIDRQLLLGADFERLVELPAFHQDVGDATHRHGPLAHVAE
jgi:hypothetical protein